MTETKEDAYATLNSRAASDAARSLTERVYSDVLSWESQENRRTYKRDKVRAGSLKEALERFVGDLLRAHVDPECTGKLYRSLDKSRFTGDVISYRNFALAVQALVALKLITHTPGQTKYLNAFGGRFTLKGKAARFRGTDKLRKKARAAGISLKALDDHFHLEPPQHPLVLRAASARTRGTKHRGSRMEFDVTPVTKKLEAQVRALNEFLRTVRITGGIHYGYTRVFNEGDLRRFSWKSGGRLYSIGANNYQQMSSVKRAAMTLNEEPVCEIDVKASYLTILHAKLGMPFDTSEDPYSRVGLDRSIVKAWTTASFGAGKPLRTWPKDVTKDYFKEHGRKPAAVCRAAVIADKMLETFPAIAHMGEPGVSWADLMYAESQGIIGAMTTLMALRIPSLSVHDSIIVPVSDVKLASGILHDHYSHHVGAVPVLATDCTFDGVKEAIARECFGRPVCREKPPPPALLL
jgi:hypothetical protein